MVSVAQTKGWSRAEYAEIESHKISQLILVEERQQAQDRKYSLFNKGCGNNWTFHV